MKMKRFLVSLLAIIMAISTCTPIFAAVPPVEETPVASTIGYSANNVVPIDLSNTDKVHTMSSLVTADGKYSEPLDNNIYTISTADELVTFGKILRIYASNCYKETAANYASNQYVHWEYHFQNVTVVLTDDIDCSSIENFEPLGGWTQSNHRWAVGVFRGTFDGQGHTIRNLTIDAAQAETDKVASNTGDGYIGFFRILGGSAQVKNLIFDESCTVTGTSWNGPMGIVTGMIDSDKSKDLIDSGKSTALSWYPVKISNVRSNATIHHPGNVVGGFVGYAKAAQITIENCTNASNMVLLSKANKKSFDGASGVGGFIGALGGSSNNAPVSLTIKNCRNTSHITSHGVVEGTQGISTGGFVGLVSNLSAAAVKEGRTLSIENCINNGDITMTISQDGAGCAGFVGYNAITYTDKCGISLTNCKNYGNPFSYTTGATLAQLVNDGANAVATTITDCTECYGEVDMTYDMVGAQFYQLSTATYVTGEESCYSLRIIATHDNIERYSKFGYKVEIVSGDTSRYKILSSTTVYRSILETKAETGTATVSASELGAKYLSAVVIDDIPLSLGKITIKCTPLVKVNGRTQIGDTVSFEIDPSEHYTAN